MQLPGRMMVMADTPVRRWLWRLALLLLVAGASYAMFELGRYKAGFDGIAAAQQRADLLSELTASQREQRAVRVQLTAAQDTQNAQVAERSELARTIGELQAQLARAELDLQFYRGIAAPQNTGSNPIRVQQFEVLGNSIAPAEFLLSFTLNRTTRSDQTIAGNIGITIDGELSGAAASVDLAALTGGKLTQLPFSFRYYATIEQAVKLPEGFVPTRATVEIRSSRKGASDYRQTFLWNPSQAP